MFALSQPKKVGNESTPQPTESSEGEEVEAQSEAPVEPEEIDVEREPKEVLKDLIAKAKDILETQKDNIGGKRKQDLRLFSKSVRKMLSRSGRESVLTDSLEAQFQELQNQLRIQRGVSSSSDGPPAESQTSESPAESPPPSQPEINYLTATDTETLRSALREMQTHEMDDNKPYAMPWMPRDYLSAFAFIPRYLEVNQNICAAVYLRHPVARPGLAEVPTPFPETISANAFAWYLRRR